MNKPKLKLLLIVKHAVMIIILFPFLYLQTATGQDLDHEGLYNEQYRPQYHFTPPKNWNNDPNGLVYYKGEYHLFYQYYPRAMRWDSMHWGHAVSTDLFHWKNLPIALYPDSLGYIFSGSAVVDKHNTSGFQQGDEKTLVAIFTYHNPNTNVESQAIAYSTDRGRTWEKYKGNPVIPNPGLKDFRDPVVRWYEPAGKWIMVVSCHDHVSFYSSQNLKNWTKESDFGKNKGSHGGVWECPNLFPVKVDGTHEKKWVLTVNNYGSPAGGGSTQYFIGDFDGHRFTADDTKVRWLNAGADEYAGIIWNNTNDRRIFIGWLNNWPEKNEKVPSYKWRGGMTLPIELSLKRLNDSTMFLVKQPVKELQGLETSVFSLVGMRLSSGTWQKTFSGDSLSSAVINLDVEMGNASKMKVSLKNDLDQHIDIIYNRGKHQLIIDRTHANGGELKATSALRHVVDIPEDMAEAEMKILYDRSVVEVFFDDGRWMTTDLVFPTELYNQLIIDMDTTDGIIKALTVKKVDSAWR